ncbi:MAG: reactive intermediate/imine deaminase [Gammaproteobacteria bacterium RIFCSPHIGHO2_12_FULL_41_20]|nr:MAG: reactive intermediate/imine deaminase [Gammaproteobacteria bacterium RIFCSPHIGHO2_12_FULL_41_20]
MSKKQVVHTALAPQAIGPYSQAVRIGDTVYFSGQIPLDPQTMTVVTGSITQQATQVFKNLTAVAEAAGGKLSDIVKLTIFLTDLSEFSTVNDVMMQYFQAPYPARTTIEVSALPKQVNIEIDAVMVCLQEFC